MKKQLTVLILTLMTTFCFGQNQKKVEIQTYKDGDTTLWYQWRSELCKPLKIPRLINSKDTFYFRFWQHGQALDIWTLDFKTFNCLLTNYIKKYDQKKLERKNPKPDKVISSQIILDTAQGRQAYYLILKYSILEIPSEEKISKWEKGLDGETFLIEISTPESYAFKSYWTPSAQGNLKEARQIQEFADSINSQLKIGKLYSEFTKTLPRGQYTNDGYGIMIIKRQKK